MINHSSTLQVFSMRNQGQNAARSPQGSNDLRDGNISISGDEEAVSGGMINVTSPTSTPNAKITFGNFDKSKEDYLRQFSEKVKIH